jgi:protein-L-isoaspartate O-methyltransferase
MPTTWMDGLMRQTRRIGQFPYPHQAAFLLDNPVRRWTSRPERVVESLRLDGTERVLELGPGPGFYSVEIARRLTTGSLHLFDLQPEMLEKARRKLARSGFRDVGFHAGDAGKGISLPDNAFDVAFLAAVIGEVPDRPACTRSLSRLLRPGGRLVFVESFPDPDRLSIAELRELVEPEGFALQGVEGTRWQDVVTFRSLPAVRVDCLVAGLR